MPCLWVQYYVLCANDAMHTVGRNSPDGDTWRDLGPLEWIPIGTNAHWNEFPLERNPSRTKSRQNEFPVERIAIKPFS